MQLETMCGDREEKNVKNAQGMKCAVDCCLEISLYCLQCLVVYVHLFGYDVVLAVHLLINRRCCGVLITVTFLPLFALFIL